MDRISAELNVTERSFYNRNETRDEQSFALLREAQDVAFASERDAISQVAAASVSLVSRQMRDRGTLLRTSASTAVGGHAGPSSKSAALP